MRRKNLVKIVILLIHLVMCLLLSLKNIWSISSGLLEFNFIQGFLFIYASTIPMAVGVAGIVDMLVAIFQKTGIHNRMHIVCGGLGVLVLALYIARSFGVVITALMYLGTLVICGCWCAQFIVDLTKRKKGLLSPEKSPNAFKVIVSTIAVLFLLGVGVLYLDYSHTTHMNDIASKIENGMSYSQVVEIMGREGEIWREDENTYSWDFGNNKRVLVEFSEETVVKSVSKTY